MLHISFVCSEIYKVDAEIDDYRKFVNMLNERLDPSCYNA